LLIAETAFAFISNELDVCRVVSRYDNRRACIAPDNSKMLCAVYQRYGNKEVLRIEQGREFTEGCNAMHKG
jgi:hypothetical protein